MRRVKMKLADGNVYRFTTLTMREANVFRKMQNRMKKEQKEMDILIVKMDTDEWTEKDDIRMEELQDIQTDILLDTVRVSLTKKHEEFKLTAEGDERKVQEKAIKEKIQDLMDLGEVTMLVNFVLSGIMPKRSEEIDLLPEEIDLTA